MPVQCKLVTHKVPLLSDFGQYLARHWFGSAVIDSLPDYTRTSRYSRFSKESLNDNGQISGWLVWAQPADAGGFPAPDDKIVFKYIEINSEVVLGESPDPHDEDSESMLEKTKVWAVK